MLNFFFMHISFKPPSPFFLCSSVAMFHSTLSDDPSSPSHTSKRVGTSHIDTYAQTQSGTHMVVSCLMELWWCFQNHNDGHFAERE